MDLEARKLSFIQEFLRLQNEEIISGLEDFLQKRKAEALEQSIRPKSLEEYESEIDQAMEDSKQGLITKASDLKAKVEKWS